MAHLTRVSWSINGKVSGALCKISTAAGMGGGCAVEELPPWYPKECVVTSHEGGAGGSVSVVITLGGDGSYELQEIRRMQSDGSSSSCRYR